MTAVCLHDCLSCANVQLDELSDQCCCTLYEIKCNVTIYQPHTHKLEQGCSIRLYLCVCVCPFHTITQKRLKQVVTKLCQYTR